jgi:hypothetical protein
MNAVIEHILTKLRNARKKEDREQAWHDLDVYNLEASHSLEASKTRGYIV